MPHYNLVCSKKSCKHEFVELCTFKDFDEKFSNIKCPECGKEKPRHVLSLSGVTFVGNPDKMNNFEYAAEKNFEKAQQESTAARAEAQRKGISPYRDLPDFTDNGRRMNFVD